MAATNNHLKWTKDPRWKDTDLIFDMQALVLSIIERGEVSLTLNMQAHPTALASAMEGIYRENEAMIKDAKNLLEKLKSIRSAIEAEIRSDYE